MLSRSGDACKKAHGRYQQKQSKHDCRAYTTEENSTVVEAMKRFTGANTIEECGKANSHSAAVWQKISALLHEEFSIDQIKAKWRKMFRDAKSDGKGSSDHVAPSSPATSSAEDETRADAAPAPPARSVAVAGASSGTEPGARSSSTRSKSRTSTEERVQVLRALLSVASAAPAAVVSSFTADDVDWQDLTLKLKQNTPRNAWSSLLKRAVKEEEKEKLKECGNDVEAQADYEYKYSRAADASSNSSSAMEYAESIVRVGFASQLRRLAGRYVARLQTMHTVINVPPVAVPDAGCTVAVAAAADDDDDDDEERVTVHVPVSARMLTPEALPTFIQVAQTVPPDVANPADPSPDRESAAYGPNLRQHRKRDKKEKKEEKKRQRSRILTADEEEEEKGEKRVKQAMKDKKYKKD